MEVSNVDDSSGHLKPDPRIFICYAQDDIVAARRLSNLCEDAGLPTWLDIREIRAGDNWHSTVNRAIHECDVFILLISEAALRSHDATRSEWSSICERQWQDSDVRLIPIRLSDVEPPVFLRNRVCLDALNDRALDTCVSEIHRLSKRADQYRLSSSHSEQSDKELIERFRTVLSSLGNSSASSERGAGEREE
jgi:hypothetical protein